MNMEGQKDHLKMDKHTSPENGTKSMVIAAANVRLWSYREGLSFAFHHQ
jgi:hypothetical protein